MILNGEDVTVCLLFALFVSYIHCVKDQPVHITWQVKLDNIQELSAV